MFLWKEIKGQDTRLFRKLQLIDDATSNVDLRVPPSNHFEQLSGKLQGKSSIRIIDQWRLIFTWNDNKGEADGIYLDNHSYSIDEVKYDFEKTSTH
jgi:proteic killer suppression protein